MIVGGGLGEEGRRGDCEQQKRVRRMRMISPLQVRASSLSTLGLPNSNNFIKLAIYNYTVNFFTDIKGQTLKLWPQCNVSNQASLLPVHNVCAKCSY